MGEFKLNTFKYLKVGLPEDIQKAECIGDFSLVNKLVDLKLKKDISYPLRKRLELEKEKVKRLEYEYAFDYDEALEIVLSRIKNFTREEFEMMKDEGYADWTYIDGKVKFQRLFFKNIIKTYPNVTQRLRTDDINEASEEEAKLIDDHIEEIIKEGSAVCYTRIRTGLEIYNDSKIGETEKVYLPIPKACQQISNIKIINTSCCPKFISPEDYQQRTIYFEKKAEKDDIFIVEYSYENHVEYKDTDRINVSSSQPDFYTGEEFPQISFTPYLTELCKYITGSEKNPLIKARKIYDYITKNVRYSYVRNYFTIENIPEYVALNLKGDCGAQALLFITLCRIAKIPAKWQSGLFVDKYSIGPHDLAQFYIEPAGWLFVDLSMGGFAYKNGNTKRWNFYFGNIDTFRMVGNSEFQFDFMPEKKF